VQMWQAWAQSRCRCGRRGPSPGADVAGVRIRSCTDESAALRTASAVGADGVVRAAVHGVASRSRQRRIGAGVLITTGRRHATSDATDSRQPATAASNGQVYFESVGKNSVLQLNAPPDRQWGALGAHIGYSGYSQVGAAAQYTGWQAMGAKPSLLCAVEP
jgi:hypothetical protein